MVDFQNRKKVYILCGKEEYATVWEHLHEIINVQEEELIIPYDFMEYEKINERIEQRVKRIVTDFIRFELRASYLNQWYNEKFNYFKNNIPTASEIIIIKNDKSYGIDRQEKEAEIEYCNCLKNKTIRFIDIEELTYQKTI